MPQSSQTFTLQEIVEKLNRAADDIIGAVPAMGDSGTVDAMNLLVNATIHYLERPTASLAEAVEVQYGGQATLEDIVSWISGD